MKRNLVYVSRSFDSTIRMFKLELVNFQDYKKSVTTWALWVLNLQVAQEKIKIKRKNFS